MDLLLQSLYLYGLLKFLMGHLAPRLYEGCLLCGFADDKVNLVGNLPACSHCEREAKSLCTEEVDALLKLDTIKPAFEVWKYGRREDSEARGEPLRNETPIKQPARIFPGLRVYIGDLDDAANVKNLKRLGIGCVINLCAEKVGSWRYVDVPKNLARAKIDHHILVADDARHFKIMEVAEVAFAIIKATLEKRVKNGVLIHCWGGINRSGATAVAFLATQCLLAGEEVAPELLQPLADPLELGDADACNDPQKMHCKDAPKDTQDHCLRFAVRDGCLKCVKHYVRLGADTWSNFLLLRFELQYHLTVAC
eukprot:symbB.v1.2.030661.t1/scaffold3479.1/size55865/7